MKKNGLLRLLGIMSCVTLLSSCAEKAPENPKLVVKAFPESFHVGETVDLDSYVSVEGTSKSYEVYLYKASQEIAKLDGHKITLKDEGEIKFKVSLGDYSQTISVDSIAAMRDALMKTFASFTGDYMVAGELSEDFFLHKPEYAERLQTKSPQLRSGYISPEDSDAVYKFKVDETYVPSYDPIIYEKSQMDKYYGTFGVDFKKATRGTTSYDSEKFETYELASSAFKNFVSNVLVSDATAYSYYTTVDGEGKYDATSTTYGYVDIALKKAKFTVYEEAGESAPIAFLYGTVGGKETLVDILYFMQGETVEAMSDALLDYYMEQGLQVGTIYPAFFRNLFTQQIPASKAYVAEFKYGWVDGSGNPIEAPDLSGTIFQDGVPCGSSTRVLSDKAIVTIKDGEIVEGILQDGNKVVSVIKEAGSYFHEVDPDYSDIYEDRYHSLAFIGTEETFKDDMLYLNEKSSTEDVLVFNANLKRHYELFDSIASCEDDASPLVPLFYSLESRDIKKYFTFSFKYTLSEAKLEVSYKLNWDTGVYYELGFSVQPDSAHAYDAQIDALYSQIIN